MLRRPFYPSISIHSLPLEVGGGLNLCDSVKHKGMVTSEAMSGFPLAFKN